MKDEERLVRRLLHVVRVHVWRRNVSLSDEECRLLKKIVRLAGFEAKRVVEGLVVVECLAADQRPTGSRRAVNELVQYKVVCADGQSNTAATAWLDQIVNHILNAQLEVREHEEPALVADVRRLIRDKRVGVTLVPDDTTAGSRGTPLPFPALG